jgi:protein TonB
MNSKYKFLKVGISCLLFLGLLYNSIAQTDTNRHAETQEDELFVITEEKPVFPGGDAALYQFLQDNLRYPEDARKEKVEGRVIVEFIVEKDGSLTNIKIIREHPHQSFNDEAIRIIESMPQWKPAKQRGTAVRFKYIQPINFRLQHK